MFMSFAERRRRYYTGKHILVAGASQGIGRSICLQLAADGAKLSMAARTLSRLEAAAVEVRSCAVEPDRALVLPIACDCSNAEAVGALVARAESELGPIDILINCAGGAQGVRFEELEPAIAEDQMKLNYFSQLYPAQAVFARMKEHGAGGQIVFTSSMAGLTGVFGLSAYAPAKFALRGLAECLFYEGRPFGIRITVLYPPDTETPGYAHEKSTMPGESIDLMASAGVFKPEKVAAEVLKGILNQQARVTIGFDGKMLGIVTAGMTPWASFTEILLMPFIRALSSLFIADFNRTIFKHKAKAGTPEQSENVPGKCSN